MATMQMPCSIKLKCLDTSLVYIGERKPSCVIASATVTRTHTSYQPKRSFHFQLNVKPMFQELPPTLPEKLETLFDKQESEEEVEIMLERLKIAVDKLVEMEINKFMERVKAEKWSKEYRMVVDEMRKEIGRKYLERPMRYLKSESKVSFEQKIKDVSFLVNMLEGSSLA